RPPAEPRLEPQVAGERTRMARQLGTVELNAAGSAQSAQISTSRSGNAVIGELGLGAEFLAAGQRQPAPGFRVDVVGRHRASTGPPRRCAACWSRRGFRTAR